MFQLKLINNKLYLDWCTKLPVQEKIGNFTWGIHSSLISNFHLVKAKPMFILVFIYFVFFHFLNEKNSSSLPFSCAKEYVWSSICQNLGSQASHATEWLASTGSNHWFFFLLHLPTSATAPPNSSFWFSVKHERHSLEPVFGLSILGYCRNMAVQPGSLCWKRTCSLGRYDSFTWRLVQR